MLGRTAKTGVILFILVILGVAAYVFWKNMDTTGTSREKAGELPVVYQPSERESSDQSNSRRTCAYQGETWSDGIIVLVEGSDKLCDDGMWVIPQEIPIPDRLRVSPTSGKAPLHVTVLVGEGQKGATQISDGGVYLRFGDDSPDVLVACDHDGRKIHDACLSPVRITHAYENPGTFTVSLWKGSIGGPYVRAQTTITVER